VDGVMRRKEVQEERVSVTGDRGVDREKQRGRKGGEITLEQQSTPGVGQGTQEHLIERL